MNLLISLMVAAGVSAWVFTKAGRRMGTGNGQSTWTLVGVTFVLVFLVFIIMLKYLIHLN